VHVSEDFDALSRDRLALGARTIVGVGCAVGLATGTFSYVMQQWLGFSTDRDPLGRYGWIVLFNMCAWVSWLALVPLMLALSRRVRVTRGRIVPPLAIHFGAALALTSAHCLFTGTLRWAMAYASGMVRVAPSTASWMYCVEISALYSFEWEVLLYGGVIAMHHAVEFYRELQHRAVEQSRLEAQLVEAQLEALQRQLHPHFLFNTLHAIASLVHRNPGAAEAMIVRLGDLLRAVFRSQVQQEVPLAREIELVRDYMDIQRVRYAGRIDLHIEAPEDADRVRVPILLLQPLVENAVKHGFERHVSDGRIHISARRLGPSLELTVADNGRGASPQTLARVDEGVGLSNTRARLERLYPGANSVTIASGYGPGFTVRLTLPWREVDEPDREPPLRVPA
jgi:signal transduction histidine kinase